jgi:4-hydroxybenzoyl-CoA reductase subunit beta
MNGFAGYAQAAGLVSSPPLRNAGTIGGNLCVDTRCNYYDMTYEWRKAAGFA